MPGGQATAKTAVSPSPTNPPAVSSTATIAAGPNGGGRGPSDAALKWAADRRISRETLAAFGATCAIEGMPDLGRTEVISLPYRRGTQTVNVKYRAIAAKKFKMKEGGEIRFFNLDAVLTGDKETAYIFEGEFDALAAFEAGSPLSQILSVPNGSAKEASDTPAEMDRYRYVITGLDEGLGAVKRFIIATDNDGPGRALRQDLVNILGAARCWFIDWPDRTKDANELLVKGGPGELLDYLEGEAKEWPVDGLFKLSDIPEPAPLIVWDAGFPDWRNKLYFAPGTLCVLTGHPGGGKTTIAAQIVFNICHCYGIKAAIASFETNAKPHHRRNIRRFMFGKWDLTDDECAKADRWNDEHLLWISHPQRRPSFRWFMDLAEVAVIRHGVKIIVLDPWNKVESDRPDMVRETDWIRDRLNEMLDFARNFGVLLLVLCHPAKGDHRTRDRRPELEDIAGSKHWDNIPDQGLSIYRPKVFDKGERKTEAQLFHLKARFEELGHECRLDIKYDRRTGRFRSAEDDIPPPRPMYGERDTA
jgi:twinkle protein